MPDDKLKLLYDKIIGTGKVTPEYIGDYNTFSSYMADSTSAQKFYNGIIKKDVFKPSDIGDFDTFYGWIKSNLQPQGPDLDNLRAQAEQKIHDYELASPTPDASGTYQFKSPEDLRNDKTYQELQRQRQYISDAKDLQTLTERFQRGEEGGGQFWKGLTSTLAKDFFTAGFTEMGRTFDMVGIARKAADGEALTEEEQAALVTYGIYQQALSNPKGTMFNFGQQVAMQVPYMVQFAATSGIGNAAELGVNAMLKVTKASLPKLLKDQGYKAVLRQVGKELPGIAVKGAAQTPFMPMTYTITGEKLIGDVDAEGNVTNQPSLSEGIWKGLAQAYPEILTESMGAHIMASIPGVGRMVGKKSPKGLTRILTPIEKFRKAAAFSNFPEEFSEEMMNNVLTPMLDPDTDFKDVWTGQNILTTALTIAATGGGFYATNQAYKALDENNLRSKYLSGLPKGMRTNVIGSLKVDDPKEVSQRLSTIISKSGLQPNQAKGILDYAWAASMRKGMAESLFEQNKEIQKRQIEKSMTDQIAPFVYKDGETLFQVLGNDGQVYWVKDGEINVNPDDNTWSIGKKPLIVVPMEGGEPRMMPVTDVNSVRTSKVTDRIQAEMAKFEQQAELEKTLKDAAEIADTEKAEAATPDLKTGDIVSYNGRNARIGAVSGTSIDAQYTDTDEPVVIPPEAYQSLQKVEPNIAAETQKTEPKSQTDKKTLKAKVGKNEVQVNFTPDVQNKALFTSDNSFSQESDANRVIKSLSDRYSGLEFTTVNTNTDPFAENNFVITAKPKTDEQVQEQTEEGGQESPAAVQEVGQEKQEELLTPPDVTPAVEPPPAEPAVVSQTAIPEAETPTAQAQPEPGLPAQTPYDQFTADLGLTEAYDAIPGNAKTGKIGQADVVVYEKDGNIAVESVNVPVDARKQGEATRAMEALTAKADELGVNLELRAVPSEDTDMKPQQLRDWYRKFGFSFIGNNGLRVAGSEESSEKGAEKPISETPQKGGETELSPQPEKPAEVSGESLKKGVENVYPVSNLSGEKFIDYPEDISKEQDLLESKWRDILRKNNGPTDASRKAQEKLHQFGKDNMYIKVTKQEGVDFLSEKPYLYGSIDFRDVYGWADMETFFTVNKSGKYEATDEAKKHGIRLGDGSAFLKFEYTPEAVAFIIRKLSESGYNVFDVVTETFYPNKQVDSLKEQIKPTTTRQQAAQSAYTKDKYPFLTDEEIDILRSGTENYDRSVGEAIFKKINVARDAEKVRYTNGQTERQYLDEYISKGYTLPLFYMPGKTYSGFAKQGGKKYVLRNGSNNLEIPVGKTARAYIEMVLGKKFIDYDNYYQQQIRQAEKQVDRNPSEEQKKAGNYKKGHVNIQGFDITIENPKGSFRSGTDTDGNTWTTEMKHTYGYFKGSEGYAGDQIDVFIGDNPASTKIFVVDQVDPKTGEFDESKVMMGFNSVEEAKQGYLANYSRGWKGLGQITEVPVEDFKTWLYDGAKQRLPYGDYKDTPEPVNVSNQSKQQPPPDEFVGDVVKKPAKKDKVKNLDKRKYTMPKRQQAVMRDSESFEESVLQFLLGGGRFSAEDYEKHTGFKSKRTKDKLYGVPLNGRNKTDKEFRDAMLFALKWGGVNFDVFHEQANTFGEEDKGAMDMTNRIVDIINQHTSKWSITKRLEEMQNPQPPSDMINPDWTPEEINVEFSDLSATFALSNDPDINAIIDAYGGRNTDWAALMNEIETDPGTFTVFPYGLKPKQFAELKKIVSDELQREKTGDRAIPDTQSKGEGDNAVTGSEATGRRDAGETPSENEGTAKQREITRIRDEYQAKINELKATLITPDEIKRRQNAEIAKANRKINIFGQEGDQGEQDVFAAGMPFGTTSDAIRKRVSDEAAAENKKINEQLERLRNDMQAEIDLAERQGNLRFQLQEDESISDNLVALHNINEGDIRNVDKLGGMVAPSIAIVQKETPYTDFGSITLIADKETVNPARSSVKVFKGDVYAPTVPRPRWYVDTKRHKAWVQRIMSKTYSGYRDIASRVQNIVDDFGSFGKNLGSTERTALKEMVYDDMKVVYLIENDIPIKIPTKGYPVKIGFNWYVNSLSPEHEKRAKELKAKYDKETEASSVDVTDKTVQDLTDLAGDIVYAETMKIYGNREGLPEGFAEEESTQRANKAKDQLNIGYFTYSLSEYLSGRQQVDESKIKDSIDKTFKAKADKKAYDEWLTDKVDEYRGAKYFEQGNKKVPYTLENLIDATTGQTRGKEKGMTFGMNRAKSFAVKQLKSTDAMHKAKKDLVTKDEMTRIEKEMQDEYFKVADGIKYKYSDQWGKLDDFGRSLADYFKGASPQSALQRNGFTPDRWDVEAFKEFAEKLAGSPIDYFEAKMQRGVDLSEFKYAIVPKDTSKDVIEILKSKGAKVKKYTDDAERSQLVDEIASKDSQVRFQITPDQVMSLNYEMKLPDSDTFTQAVENTQGAKITDDGLLIDLVRYQQDEQGGDLSVRTGVFYLPVGSPQEKYYRGSKTNYGGTTKIVGTTLIRRPIFVKGATGGKAPEVAYDQIKGKGAYQKMRSFVLSQIPFYGKRLQPNDLAQILTDYNDGTDYDDNYNIAYDIIRVSTKGNTLAYAIQENIVAHAVREAGYDSVVGYSLKKDGDPFISEVFDVREITYPMADEESDIHEKFLNDNIRFQLQPGEDMFYSNSIRALDAIKQGKATPEQWKAMLLKNGAKEAELEWFGWNDFVQGKRSFTKNELSDWMNANRVRLEEVELQENPDVRKVYEQNYTTLQMAGFEPEIWEDGVTVTDKYGTAIENLAEAEDYDGENKEILIDFFTSLQGLKTESTKYHDYQTPGGKDYKELLITMPEISRGSTSYTDFLQNKGINNDQYNELPHIEQHNLRVEYSDLTDSENRKPNQNFRSSHFDQPNIVVHVRFNSRVDANGDNVLFIEEIQSDWAEKGRKEGFRIPNADKEAEQFQLSLYDKYNIPKNEFLIGNPKVSEEDQLKLSGLSIKARGGIPNMPFRNTQQWVGLALKRMVRYAAENGYDRIAWTTGEQQAERYDLSKQVDRVEYRLNEGGTYNIYPYHKEGGAFGVQTNIQANEIENVIGKEVAQKIIDNAEVNKTKTLNNLDLKVGGEGMKAFYDNIIPNTANKLFGKYGAKVGTTAIRGDKLGYDKNHNIIPEGFEQITVPSLPITPELGEAAMSAQPMFRLETNPLLSKDAEFIDDVVFGKNWKGFLAFHNTLTQMAARVAEQTGTKITVVKSAGELPNYLRGAVQRKNDQGNFAPALFYENKNGEKEVWIISNQTRSTSDAGKSLLHEVVAHHGLRKLFGEKYENILRQVWAQMPESEKRRLAGLYKSTDRLLLADEWLAKQAETLGGETPSWIRKIFSQIRQLLRDVARLNLKFTDNDLKAMFTASRENLAKEAAKKPVTGKFAGEVIFDMPTLRQQIIGETGAGKISTRWRYRNILKDLELAKNLEQTGTDAATIRRATGWEKGIDGKWRAELNDKKTSIKKKYSRISVLNSDKSGIFTEPIPLKDIMDNDELFRAYPELKDYSITFYNFDYYDTDRGADGFHTPGRKLIGIAVDPTVPITTIAGGNRGMLPMRFDTERRNSNQKGVDYQLDIIKSSLVHEVQHIIQRIEGFDTGGNLETAWGQSIAELRTRVSSNPAFTQLNPQSQEKYLEKIRRGEVGGTTLNEAKIRNYQRVSGEVEGRNVVNRIDYDDESRLAETLLSTEDINREDQIRLSQQLKDEQQFQIIGEQGAQRLVDAGLSVDSINNLSIAKEMESAGKSEKEIWLATGWQKGKEGKWRMEVPDLALKESIALKPKLNAVIDLTDLINAPAILKAYPNLKNIVVFLDVRKDQTSPHGAFIPSKGNIGEDVIPSEIHVFASSMNEAKSILTHEVQHAVQHDEGFAKGSNLENAPVLDMKPINEIRAKIKALNIDPYAIQNQISFGHYVAPETMQSYERWLELKNQEDALLSQIKSPYEAYKRVAGEVEARNAQRRLHYTDAQRAIAELSQSEDVAREDQIVLMESVKSALDLTPEVPQTETEAFKKWFGNSKVVDENGKPLVVYHGTDKSFDAFKGLNYFTVEKSVANDFAEMNQQVAVENESLYDGVPNVMPVYLRIENPYMVDDYEDMMAIAYQSNEIKDLQEQGYDGVMAKDHSSILTFSPTQIKSATGNQGTFDATNPDIRFSLQPPPPGIAEPYVPEDLAPRDMFDTEKGRLDVIFKKAIENVFDSDLTVKLVEDEVERRGGKFNAHSRPYREANMSRSKAQAEKEKFDQQIVAPWEKVMTDIIQTTKGSANPLTYRDIWIYLVAKHAPERNRDLGGASGVAAGSIDGNKLTDATAHWYIQQFEDNINQYDGDLLQKLWDARNKMTRFVLNHYLNDGMISREVYDKLTDPKTGWEHYVPYRGWKDNLNELFDYQVGELGDAYNPFRRADGRLSESDDPTPYMISMGHTAILAGAKNEYKRQMANLILLNPEIADAKDLFWFNKVYRIMDSEGNMIDEKPQDKLPGMYIEKRDNGKITVIGEGVKGNHAKLKKAGGVWDFARRGYTFEPNFEESLRMEFPIQPGTVTTKITDIHKSRKPLHLAKQHEVNVWMNGERAIMVFADPKVGHALNRNNFYATDLVTDEYFQRFIGTPTRYLAQVLTSKNPAFWPVNMTRDIGYAWAWHAINSDQSAPEFIRNIPVAIKATHRYLKANTEHLKPRDMGMLNDTDKMYERWRMAGGETSYFRLHNIDKIKKNVERDMKVLAGELSVAGEFNENVIKKAGEWLDIYSQLSENISRFATYMTAYQQYRKKGIEDEEAHKRAVADSKNVTVNFDKYGRVTPLLKAFYLFIGPNLGGMYNIAKLANKNRAAFAKGAIAFMLIGLASAEITRLLSPPDDDDPSQKEYDTVNDFIRENYLVLPNPMWWFGDGMAKENFITIPMPQGFRALYAAGVIMSDIIHGKKTIGQGLAGFAAAMGDAFMPVSMNFTAMGEKGVTGGRLLRPAIPDVVKPIFDAYVWNEDFAGRMISREPFTQALAERLPEYTGANSFNNPYIVMASRWLNKLGGGDDLRAATFEIGSDGQIRHKSGNGIFDINPARVEYLIEQYTGGVGTELNNLVKTTTSVVQKFSGDEDAKVDTRNIPILRRFYRTASGESSFRQYNELKREVEDHFYFQNTYKKAGEVDEYIRLRQNPYMQGLKKLIDRTEKQSKRIDEVIDWKQQNEESVKEYYDKMEEMYRKVLQEAKAMKKED